MHALESLSPFDGETTEVRAATSGSSATAAGARDAIQELTALAVQVLEGGVDRAGLAPLITRCVASIRAYHAALLTNAIPALLASGRAGRTLAAHVEHLLQLQSIALSKLTTLGTRVETDARAVREIVVTSLVLMQDLEAQNHYLGAVAIPEEPLPGAA